MRHMRQVRQPLFVLGLDCFDPVLAFDRWLDDLPNLSRLTQRGVYGRLESTIPPITVPAWTCMLTGKDPGELGLYGFRNRADYSYERMSIATSDKIRHPRVWDRVSEAGGTSVVVGVPQTYPVRPLNGIMVGCFLTPSTSSAYTYPSELKLEIAQAVGEYMLDVPDFRTEDKARLLRDIYRMSRVQFDLVSYLLRTRADWDMFMVVSIGPDRIQHGFWKYMDPRHPQYSPGNPFESAIHDYYLFIDRQIGTLLSLLPADAALIVMSDHGAQAMVGGICINDWLIEQGYLTLIDKPAGIVPLERCEIDWGRTTAWGAGGYYGRLSLNVAGREPNGIVPPNQVEAVKTEIAAGLQRIADPAGRGIGTRVYRPEKAYAQVNSIPPDLIVYFGNLAWRSVGSVGNRSVHVFENDTGPDDANHAQHGMYVMWRPEDRLGRQADHTWRAIAPTMLETLGMDIPPDMSTERLT
jgi:predicted AlkP superfamily phosphohydrolase/phosphomutase